MPLYPKPIVGHDPYFSDPNMKLVVLDDLRNQGLIELGTPEEFAFHVLGRKVDFDDIGYNLIPECRDFLYHYPLNEDLLRKVKKIIFDGGLNIYTYAYPHWTGESEDFTVKTIAGVHHCSNVTRYRDIALCHEKDLSYLAPLMKLDFVGLSLHRYENIDALLALPVLKNLSLFRSYLAPEQMVVIKQLKDKGVEVSLN